MRVGCEIGGRKLWENIQSKNSLVEQCCCYGIFKRSKLVSKEVHDLGSLEILANSSLILDIVLTG